MFESIQGFYKKNALIFKALFKYFSKVNQPVFFFGNTL